MIDEKDLLFILIRTEKTPQWSVSVNDKEIATVSETVIEQQDEARYWVSIPGKNERLFWFRESVLAYLLKFLRNQ